MSRGRVVGLTMVIGIVIGLTGCSVADAPRRSDTIYAPPHLGDWIEIEGSWAVTADDGGTGALLQPALPQDPDTKPGEPRTSAGARWIDVITGESVWERDDLGSVFYLGDEHLVAAVGAGSGSVFAAPDLATGETIWSVPESEIGECAGWRLVDWWYDSATDETDGDESDDGEEVPPSRPACPD